MIELALVGLGRWGRVLIASIQDKSPHVRFRAAVTRTPELSQDYARENGIALHDRIEAALADPHIAGVVLTSPHSKHAAQAEQAIAAGRHVFVEKPFTLTVGDARRVIEAAEAAGLVLAAGHNRRFLPAMVALKRLVTEGRLGRVLHIEGNMSGPTAASYPNSWRADAVESPAGGLAGAGIHLIDAMVYLEGRIEEVTAQSLNRIVPLEMDDTTSALFRFRSGASGYLGTMTATAPTFRLHLFGSEGSAELRGERELGVVDLEGTRVQHDFPPLDMERAELEAFAAAIEGRAPYPVPMDEVVAGIAAFEAIPRAAAEGRRIRLA